MLVVPPTTLRTLQAQIIAAMQTCTDVNGKRVIQPTVEAKAMASAAMVALQIVTGEVVWPGDKPLQIPSQRQRVGVLAVEEG